MKETTTSTESIKKPVQRRRIMKPMDVGKNAESKYKTYSDKKNDRDKALTLLEKLKKENKSRESWQKPVRLSLKRPTSSMVLRHPTKKQLSSQSGKKTNAIDNDGVFLYP